MSLQQHQNDTAREARSGLWIFKGKTLVLLVSAVAMGLGIFKSLVTLFDWPLALGIGLVPLGLAVLFVARFINGRPKSYASDSLLLAIWKIKTWAYMAGLKDRPVLFWIRDRVPKHPKAF